MAGKTLSARPRPAAAEPPPAAAGEVPGAPSAPMTTADGAAPAAPAAAPPSRATAPAGVTAGKAQNLQDQFLNLLRKGKTPVTMFLVKGVKLQGIVTWFDNFSILLRRDGQSQLVYKHAISTIMPSQPLALSLIVGPGEDTGRKPRLLQDIFLSSVRDAGVPVTMFLVNGVMLQGRVASYDLFCMLLEREGYVQLAYKHAVSTIQPTGPVDLTGEADGEDAGR
ncbi:MAG: RNA chaperone Hfq [Novosphingobium sp.]